MKLSYKIYGVIATVLIIMSIISGIAISSMSTIGKMLVEIAEEDIPLTNAVAEITVNQLEQALWLERAIRAAQTNNAVKLTESEHEFEQLNELVNEEILEAEALVEEAIAMDNSEEAKRKFVSIKSGLEEVEASHATYATHAEALFEMFNAGHVDGAEEAIEKLVAEEEALDHNLEAFLTELETFTVNSALDAEHTEQSAFKTLTVFSIAGVLLGSIIGFFLARSIIAPILNAGEIMQRIADGDFSSDIEAKSSDEIGQLTGHMGEMQQNLKDRIESDRLMLLENGRIRQALGNVNSNVMIADIDLNIVYMNDAVTELFNAAESDIRKDLPNFDAKNLIGSCIDMFHKNPAHQRNLLGGLNTTHTAEISLGDRSMQVIANPVFSDDGERVGAVVEWTDRTQELAIEDEVKDVVQSALAGDLSKRIAMDNKDGFFEALSQGVNQLVGISERVIEDTIRVLSAMAAGDLNKTIDTDYEGSFGQLKQDANATVAKLTEVVGNIQSSAGSVKTGADEISQGNTDLSQRTEEQASSLEETASSMEEMTSTVRQNADNAVQANQLAQAAREQAQKGGSVVGQAVQAMGEINASSKKISDIIGVIDEIAFQTNLLALNASVEAARAGDQGRGFAVVASEVRNLAGRSATAAKEIKDLIEDSGAKVDEGSRLVNESGEMLEEIVNGVKKVTDIVGEIASASQEQSSGIDEVNKAITQMDELTQQNAALVEEAAAASESLGDQADDLNQMITFFSVNGEAAAKSAAAPAATVERRSDDRPWTAAESGNAGASAASAAKRQAAANGSDQEWEEF